MSALSEVLATFVLVTVATLVLSVVGRTPPLDAYVPLVVGALFLWTALHMSQRQPDGVRRHGLALAGLLEPPDSAPTGLFGTAKDLLGALARTLPSAVREFGVALLAAAVVFPPFVAGFYLWHGPSHEFVPRLPADLGSYALSQLLVVALPEEALFRGYVQSRLSEQLGGTRRLLGAQVSVPAWLLQAALFALLHFAVDLAPARLAVFFPALLFGWVRSLRGGIGAAAALHAMCNLLSDVLVRSWL